MNTKIIKAYHQNRKILLKDVARDLQITHTYLSHVVNQKKTLSISRKEAWCEILEESVDREIRKMKYELLLIQEIIHDLREL